MTKTSKTKIPDLDDALLIFRRTMNEALRIEAGKLGQSLAHFEVLKYVAERGDPTMKSLSDHLRITPPSASALVDALVDKKLLSRSYSPNDRRTIRITLTASSQRLLASLYKTKASVFTTMLKNLNKEERIIFATLLAKCATTFNHKE